MVITCCAAGDSVEELARLPAELIQSQAAPSDSPRSITSQTTVCVKGCDAHAPLVTRLLDARK